jgi:uncharacterized protein (DUF342 family)
MLEENVPYAKHVVASGRLPVDEEDGKLILKCRPVERPSPKVLENGAVDYKDLGMVQQCAAGQILAIRIQPSGGEDGMDVYGNVMPKGKGKNAPPLPAGKNVLLASDGLSLLAGLTGQIKFEGGKISVEPSLVIYTDVGPSTGNIDFIGTVKVEGGVWAGFSIKASEDIEIAGIAENAMLDAGRSISVSGGIRGGLKSIVKAGLDVTAKFIESAEVRAGGAVHADSILNCSVWSGSDIVVSGKTGVLVGGKAVAARRVIAKTIGSTKAVLTEIEVGHDPVMLDRYKALKAQYKTLKEELERYSRIAPQTLKESMKDSEKARVVRTLQTKINIRDKLGVTQKMLKDTLDKLEGVKGAVYAGVIRQGAKVVIGNAVMYVRSDLGKCSLVNEGGRIAIRRIEEGGA